MAVLQINEKLYIGLDADRASITPEDADQFLATDTGTLWHGSGAAWVTASGDECKCFQITGDYDANYHNFRVQNIIASGSNKWTFVVPNDFNSLISAIIPCVPSVGAAGSGKNIDMDTEYGADGEDYNNHTESDAATVYDFTGLADKFASIDVAGILTGIAVGDRVGLNITHNAIGGTIHYLYPIIRYL